MSGSFIFMNSQDILPLCQMAKTIIQLEFNIKKKKYEERLEKYRPWDSMSWREKWKWFYNPQLFPDRPSKFEIYFAEEKLEQSAKKIRTIETACLAASSVYITFADFQWLKDRQAL